MYEGYATLAFKLLESLSVYRRSTCDLLSCMCTACSGANVRTSKYSYELDLQSEAL